MPSPSANELQDRAGPQKLRFHVSSRARDVCRPNTGALWRPEEVHLYRKRSTSHRGCPVGVSPSAHSSSPYGKTMPRSNSSVSLATSVLTLSAAQRWIVSSFFITVPIE